MASGIMTPPKLGDSVIKDEKSLTTELEMHLKKMKDPNEIEEEVK